MKCKVILFKSINSRGEIDAIRFQDLTNFKIWKETLEDRYTLTILEFNDLSEKDAKNFDNGDELDELDLEWHCP